MVSLGIISYFCLYKTQENIKNIIFIMVLRGARKSLDPLRSPIPALYFFLGSYSLVGIGKFKLLFLWPIGVVSPRVLSEMLGFRVWVVCIKKLHKLLPSSVW